MQVKYLCDDMSFELKATSAQRSKNNHLDVSFRVKTCKPLCSYGATVTERCTWQQDVATYLQGHFQPFKNYLRHLRGLGADDPFQVSNFDAIITCLHDLVHVEFSAISENVEDRYYSIPHEHLLPALRDPIKNSDLKAFQNSCRVRVDSFLELFSVYCPLCLLCTVT